MDSIIAATIKFQFGPVALLWSDDKPEGATEFKPGKWGCVMWLLASAAKGKSAVASARTFGCPGGGVGLGFGNQYLNFAGGLEGFYHFLSIGNQHWEPGRQLAEKIKPFLREEMYEHFVHGEGYVQTPAGVKRFVQCLPIMQIPKKYVVLKPLAAVDPAQETPEVVAFLADPDQLSALVVLANYARGDNENVIIPYAAGCQTLGIYPYQEARSERPRAVVGLTDLSARLELHKLLAPGLLTFAVPWRLFQEMEHNVPDSFLERGTWKKLMELKKGL